jgi:hypothetical protein
MPRPIGPKSNILRKDSPLGILMDDIDIGQQSQYVIRHRWKDRLLTARPGTGIAEYPVEKYQKRNFKSRLLDFL